jgi:hypothetical protein
LVRATAGVARLRLLGRFHAGFCCLDLGLDLLNLLLEFFYLVVGAITRLLSLARRRDPHGDADGHCEYDAPH